MTTLQEGWRLTLKIQRAAFPAFHRAYDRREVLQVLDEKAWFFADITMCDPKTSTLWVLQSGEVHACKEGAPAPDFNPNAENVLICPLGDQVLCKVKVLGGFDPGTVRGFGECGGEYGAAIETHRANLAEVEAAIRDGFSLIAQLSGGAA